MKIVAARGAGEAYRNNMVMGALGGLKNVVELQYPAEVRPIGQRTLAESVVLARRAFNDIDAKGESWVGIAYSLGAYALTEYVLLDRPKNCKGLVLLGNPLRPRGKCANAGVPGDRFGLAGEVPVAGVPVHDFSVPDDPISACPGDNGLRLIANGVTGRRQPDPVRWWDAFGTIEWGKKYLIGGRHTAYNERIPGSQQTYIQAARDALIGML